MTRGFIKSVPGPTGWSSLSDGSRLLPFFGPEFSAGADDSSMGVIIRATLLHVQLDAPGGGMLSAPFKGETLLSEVTVPRRAVDPVRHRQSQNTSKHASRGVLPPLHLSVTTNMGPHPCLTSCENKIKNQLYRSKDQRRFDIRAFNNQR